MSTTSFKADNLAKYRELANSIKGGLGTEGNVIKEVEPHSAYYANLPEGITKDTIETVAGYNSRFVTATHLAIGELAADVFSKDKSVTSVVSEVGYFGKGDKLEVKVDRSKQFTNQFAKTEDEKTITKYLVMNTTVTTTSVRGTGLKAVRDSMSEEFAEMFK